MSIRHLNRGFTLIELMIAVLIISILSMFAYPTYVGHMQKTRRSDAITGLNEVVRLQEENFIRYRSYAEDLKKLGYATTTIDSQQAYYDISLTATPSGCASGGALSCSAYIVTAVPNTNTSQSTTQQKDETCQSFSLTNRGTQSAKDKSNNDTTAKCWR